MKSVFKKRKVFGSIIGFVVIAVVLKFVFFGSAASTSGAAQIPTDFQPNSTDIICEETGGLLCLPGDWHRWRGKNFDAIVIDSTLNLNWLESTPSVAWIFRYSGAGYSGPAVVGNTLYMSGAAQGHDFAFALDTRTGNLKWQQVLGDHFVQDYGDGPRGTITVDGDKLYLVRGGGQVHCLKAIDGAMVWQRDFVADFGGRITGPWGYSESLLVDGDLVIATPGGREGTMVALDKNTGETVWIAKEWTDQAGYSSPIVAVVDGVRQYIQQSANGV